MTNNGSYGTAYRDQIKNNKKKIRREGQRVKQLKYELSWSQEM